MVIKLPRDDLGVLRLKKADATAPVAAPTATARVGSQPSPAPSTPVAAPEERRRGERRQGRQRRGQGRSAVVLLDTRSHYERRTHERRRHATAQGQPYRPQGIDIHI
jgi:hypothetical protein